jgi:hypothetical protein
VSVCTSSDGRQLMRHCNALCCCSHARWPGRVLVSYARCVPACACAPESMACLHRIRRIEDTSVVISTSYMSVPPYSSPSLTQTRVDEHYPQ